jgi:hypothetical protein
MDNIHNIIEKEKGYYVRKEGRQEKKLTDLESAIFIMEKWKRTHSEVESGIIQVTLAIFAISAIFVNQQINIIVRGLSSIVLLLSFMASFLLTWTYLIPRISFTRLHFRRSIFAKNKYFPILLWLPYYYTKQLFRSVFTPFKIPFEEQTTELGYLTFLASVFILEVATLFIIFSAFQLYK